MKEWPEFNESGDLPIGIHRAALAEVIDHFGRGSFQRAIVAQRLGARMKPLPSGRLNEMAKNGGLWR